MCSWRNANIWLGQLLFLTHWGPMRHIYASKFTIIGLDYGLPPAWSAPSHYLNQWWNIVNLTLRNKIQSNIDRNSYIFIPEKKHLYMSSAKCWPFCLSLHVLTHRGLNNGRHITGAIFSNAFHWMNFIFIQIWLKVVPNGSRRSGVGLTAVQLW